MVLRDRKTGRLRLPLLVWWGPRHGSVPSHEYIVWNEEDEAPEAKPQEPKKTTKASSKQTSKQATRTSTQDKDNTENAVPTASQSEYAYMDMMQSPVAMMPYKQDDLKMVEGIGPKIAQLLQDGGIRTWKDLANTSPEDITTILRAAGERYRIHDPTTWPEQAQLAVEHKWDELEEYQNALSGGKDLTRIYKNTAN